MSVDPRSQCPIASSLDLLGDRWSLVVMRDVLFGLRHSFSEIGADEGIATNVLTERLDRLVDAKILQRRSHPEDGRRRVYLPTERGIDLIPLLLELVVWGQAHTSAPGPAGLLKAIRGDRDAVIRDFKARARASLKRPA